MTATTVDRPHRGPVARLAARIGALRGWRRLAVAALAGAVLTAGHAPVHLPWLWFLAMPVVVWTVAGARSPRGAWAAGWAAGFGYLVTSLHWIGHAFLVDAAEWALFLPFAILGLPAGLALFWGFAAWAARASLRQPRGAATEPLAMALALGAALTLTEFARSHVLTGFPWALPGYVWIGTPLAQLAAWTGPHGLTLLTLVGTALPLVLLAKGRVGAAGLAVAGVAGLAALGWGRTVWDAPAAAPGPVVRVVQPDAKQHLKWKAEHAATYYGRLLDGSAAPPDPALGPPAAVIWPETSVAFLPDEYPDARARMSEAAGGRPLLMGALRREAPVRGAPFANSLFEIGPGGEIGAVYDKHHLVPFGEYLPLGGILRGLGIRQLAERGEGFRPGPGPRVMEAEGLPPFVPLICYEAIFPHEVRSAAMRDGDPRPTWLLQVTNDAWFGAFAGPRQHLDQARMRAIELGLPVVRAANTGISAVIDSFGRIVASLPLNRHGHLDAKLPSPQDPTTYARIGSMPPIFLTFVLWLAVAMLQDRRARG